MKAIYARQSLDKKESVSIEGQIELCKAKLLPEEPYLEYTDKGYSGKNIERPSLDKLLKDIQDGRIDAVIVYRLDRFSRNITDFYNMYEVMTAHNCDFMSVSEAFDTSTSMGRAMMGILITFAQMERENIQQRVKDNYYYRISESGTWASGPAPYGFTNGRTTDNKPTLIPCESEIEAVKMMYRLYLESTKISLAEVARQLREKGYTSRAGGWTSSTISKILQNTVYVKADDILYDYLAAGHINFLNERKAWDGRHSAHIVGKKTGNANVRKYETLENTSVYVTNFQGIIDSRDYIAAMDRLGRNEAFSACTKSSRLQELGGKLKCTCGRAILAYGKSTNGRPYISCYGRRILKTCSHKYNHFNFYRIQEEVGEQIQQRLGNLHSLAKAKEEAREKRQEQISVLEKQLVNLVRIASTSGELKQAVVQPIEDTQKQINSLRLDIKLNYDNIDRLHIPELTADGIALKKYDELEMDQKKYVIGLLIDRIVLHEESGSIEIIWNK